MKTIAELFGHMKANGSPDNYGIECELENIRNLPDNVPSWRAEEDGSLRFFGKEFVTRMPVPFDDVRKVLDELRAGFEAGGIKPLASNLCSSHIHVDVRDLTVRQLLDFVALLMVFEVDIAKNSGVDRFNNYFALGSCEADATQRKLIGIRTERDFVRFVQMYQRGDLRYSGINFDSIGKYGSLELRFLGGQADPREIFPWIVFYNNLKDLAREGVDFQDVFAGVSEERFQDFLNQVQVPFEPHFDNLIAGVRNAQDFVFGIHNKRLGAPENGNGLKAYYDKL